MEGMTGVVFGAVFGGIFLLTCFISSIKAFKYVQSYPLLDYVWIRTLFVEVSSTIGVSCTVLLINLC